MAQAFFPHPYAPLNNPLVVSSVDFSILADKEEALENATFLPAECDCKMRDTWFYDDNEDSVKSVEELFGMYENSIGHGSNFLLNISPDNRGLLPEKDKNRLLELGEKIKENYSNPLPFSPFKQEENALFIENTSLLEGKRVLANTLTIEEDLSEGQSVLEFQIYAYLPTYKKKKILLYEGKTIGHKSICRFASICASKFEVVITKHEGDYKIKNISAFFVK